MTTIYSAKRIITMNPSQPEATYIAIRDGRILAVGTQESMKDFEGADYDNRFENDVILPGFVEGHSHALEGALWNYGYLGYFGRTDPEGKHWEGLRSVPDMQARLSDYAASIEAETSVIAWGFDPVYFPEERLDRYALDAAVPDRPVVVFHANLHVMTVNTAMLKLAKIDQVKDVEGIRLGTDGKPDGELQEMAAMHVVFDTLGFSVFDLVASVETLQRYARIARRSGVTTITDLYNPLSNEGVAALESATTQPSYPVRLVPAMAALSWSPQEGIERLRACQGIGHDKLHFGPVKLMTDGSIQGYTARLKWPYYHDGSPNGIWNAPPQQLKEMVHSYHQAGAQLHIHCNGDEAVDLMLDAIEEAQEMWPRADHRHTLQHCQIMDHAQLRRAARLGVCLNIFANHLYYWGDIHLKRTLGFERCQRLEPLASTRRLNIPLAIHSDAPVTPLGPLFTAWCAVMRKSASGIQLGEHENLSVAQALEAITLGAAYTLRMDHLVGSLEIGKFADMVVLEEDPLTCDPDQLKDTAVKATVLGGQVHVNE
ncbi:amidohydrolase [Halomonas sp. M20]|uniref:amidohydrolase n=1 Tax=Halomonas sp. M20 TaxID=2763264 RepID=UPI001D0A8A8D|nr:amidohydrolase [Halomonas sp. M20]